VIPTHLKLSTTETKLRVRLKQSRGRLSPEGNASQNDKTRKYTARNIEVEAQGKDASHFKFESHPENASHFTFETQ